ncbi:response regulator transcription factor [Opitutus terrae]|uniref:Two component transcriptional regulator, LuxR family n=1 Tax=Opitutus terrae (strain DSM 11246 / JCM 15787 / PB90-1) TaxID=452637 RepID=B1ZPE7_OPITP|nr:response regulator transcription factor [Opitutus terrae]ACB73552.1 two component transcriptional regulator, LuxR family [Opitutus terrae PB90-1]
MKAAPNVAVGLVEDDAPYRAYVTALLESTGERRVAFAVGSAEEGLARIAEAHVNVLLLDLRLPGISGGAAVQKFLTVQPDLLVIMLTALDAEEPVIESIKSGACGYLLKGASSEAVLGAVDDALAGGAPMSPSIARRVLGLLRAAPTTMAKVAEGKLAALTAREEEVLARVAAGRSDKEIAAEFGTALSTIKNHLANIYAKWRVRSRTEAAVRFLGR